MTDQEELEIYYDEVEANLLQGDERLADDYFEDIKLRLKKYRIKIKEDLAVIKELLNKKEEK